MPLFCGGCCWPSSGSSSSSNSCSQTNAVNCVKELLLLSLQRNTTSAICATTEESAAAAEAATGATSVRAVFVSAASKADSNMQCKLLRTYQTWNTISTRRARQRENEGSNCRLSRSPSLSMGSERRSSKKLVTHKSAACRISLQQSLTTVATLSFATILAVDSAAYLASAMGTGGSPVRVSQQLQKSSEEKR